MDKVFYVYVAFRPWDGSPCYVGKGKGKRWQRFNRGDRTNRHLLSIVAKAKRIGMELPVIKVREGLTESEAFETERAFIAAIGRGKYGPLVNRSDGGDGPTGARHSLKSRKKIGQDSRQRWAESRDAIIAAQNAGRATPEYRSLRSTISKKNASDPKSRARQSKAISEKFTDPEFCEKHSVATKKAMARPEVKAKTSAGQKARFERPEEREKSAQRSTGRKQSAETIAKKSAKLTGQKRSAESCAAMSAAQSRRAPPSAETRAKMSASAKMRADRRQPSLEGI